MAASPPGAVAVESELQQRLASALASRPADWMPRTKHRDGSAPHFINRLALETSPYLLQHAHNPVDWHPWGTEAFEKARALGRPVLLSVGYATCHWCHVMEEESFEDLAISRLMNERYVCIKVDREERPDVDAIYMAAVQTLQGGGGWPMTVWLDADQQPFFAGTYFPPRDGVRRGGRGFEGVLLEIAELYAREPLRIREAATELTEAVKEQLGSRPTASAALPPLARVDAVCNAFKRLFDPIHGGTNRAPKFPSNVPYRLLFRHHTRTGDAASLHIATFTLERMAAGGLHDQLAGGFHRYSVDGEWLVPHFEKMLYDNALLTVAYLEAFQLTGKPLFERVVRETLGYLLREMRAPSGAFFSATDADSEGEEGTAFLWSLDTLKEQLGAEAETFASHFGVTAGGNFEGKNILFEPKPDEAVRASLAGARAKLLALRNTRPQPLLDDKQLVAWNGLAISALAQGGRILGEPAWLEAAAKAASFLLAEARLDGRLARTVSAGRPRHLGYLDDHAFLAAGLLDLWEATFEPRWLEEATALMEALQATFADPAGGWFMTSSEGERLLARERPNYDGAEPSGTSIAAMCALRLAALTGEERWREVGERALASMATSIEERPLGLTELLLALEFAHAKAKELAVIWPDGPRDLQASREVDAAFTPACVRVGAESSRVDGLAARIPPLAERRALGGKTTFFVCEEGACQLPTSSAEEARRQLGAR